MKGLSLALLSFQIILAFTSIYSDAPNAQAISDTFVDSSGYSIGIPSQQEFNKMRNTLSTYVDMIEKMPAEDRERVLTKKSPSSLGEALDLVVREALLFQHIYSEQILALEDFQANPQNHRMLASLFERNRKTPSALYCDAKTIAAWCNVLIRYAGWIARNQERGRDQVDRLFEMLYRIYRRYLDLATEGLEDLLEKVPGLSDLESNEFCWIIFKFREEFVSPPSYLRQTIWFHDAITPALLFYGASSHILMPFITESTRSRLYLKVGQLKFIINDFEPTYPNEFQLLVKGPAFKLEQKGRSHKTAPLKEISKLWSQLASREAFKIINDWADESITDFDFEKSYIKPLGQKVPEMISTQQKAVNDEKEKKKGKKQKKGNKKNKNKKKQKWKSGASSSSTKPSKSEKPDSISEITSIKIETNSIDEAESGPSSNSTKSVAIDASASTYSPLKDNGQQIQGSPAEEKVIETPLDFSTEEIASEMAEGKGVAEEEDSIEDWSVELKRQRDHYALEEKKLTQIRKVIHQQKAAKEKSQHHSRVRQNMKGQSVKSNFRTLLDSTELCLAYPDAFGHFLSNENICTIKAKKYQWFFDSNVTIKQDHMNFLCILFNLMPGKGQLTFMDMAKAFWAIEKCFRKGKEGKDLRRTVFEWSHRFEINNLLVSPVKKEIHPEHETSRFNHHQAHDLFNGGGFDPRFFIPI